MYWWLPLETGIFPFYTTSSAVAATPTFSYGKLTNQQIPPEVVMDHVIQQLLIVTMVVPLGGGGPNASLHDFLSFDWLDCTIVCLLTTGVE